MSSQLEQAETKAIQLTQKNSSLESQLADAQVHRISFKRVLLYEPQYENLFLQYANKKFADQTVSAQSGHYHTHFCYLLSR